MRAKSYEDNALCVLKSLTAHASSCTIMLGLDESARTLGARDEDGELQTH